MHDPKDFDALYDAIMAATAPKRPITETEEATESADPQLPAAETAPLETDAEDSESPDSADTDEAETPGEEACTACAGQPVTTDKKIDPTEEYAEDFDALLNECVTLVGMHHYYGGNQVKRGTYLRCHKEPKNDKDQEAIYAALPVIGKVAYLANNTFTVLKGTQSAGRVYDKVGPIFFVQVLFEQNDKAIAKVLKGETDDLNEKWRNQFFTIKEQD